MPLAEQARDVSNTTESPDNEQENVIERHPHDGPSIDTNATAVPTLVVDDTTLIVAASWQSARGIVAPVCANASTE